MSFRKLIPFQIAKKWIFLWHNVGVKIGLFCNLKEVGKNDGKRSKWVVGKFSESWSHFTEHPNSSTLYFPIKNNFEPLGLFLGGITYAQKVKNTNPS